MRTGAGGNRRGRTLSAWHAFAIFLLISLSLTGLARGDQRTLQPIVPGVGIGPARLGMTEAQARRALEAVGLEDAWCAVEIAALHHRVVALGTRFGGCAELRLPPAARSAHVMVVGRMLLDEPDAMIGGSPRSLVRAFGQPVRFGLGPSVYVLLWSNGLVVRTAVSEDGGVITYFAVVRPGTTFIPRPLLSVIR